jgi:preprotein translocase subunit YajC
MFAAGASNMYMTVGLIIIMVVMMYFSMVRGPKKQQEKRKEMMNGLHKGDTIVTVGGLYGVIDSVDPKKGTVVLDSNGVFLTFSIQAIGHVNKAAEQPKAKAEKKPEAKPAEKAAGETSDDK